MNDNELDYPMFGLLSVESRNVLDRSPFELQIIRQCAFRIPYLKIKSVFLEIRDDYLVCQPRFQVRIH